MKEFILLDPLMTGLCFIIIVVIVMWFIINIIKSIKDHCWNTRFIPAIIMGGAIALEARLK